MEDQKREYKVEWSGNENIGAGTTNDKSESSAAFLDDKSKQNPEDLFLSSLSACHMVLYLHLCETNKIEIADYIDKASGVMIESEDGSKKFKEVTLSPIVTIKNEDQSKLAYDLHIKANDMSFIANSCDFKTGLSPTIKVQ
jgi:organic hydroperoxide reductase OsmC/OhrA